MYTFGNESMRDQKLERKDNPFKLPNRRRQLRRNNDQEEKKQVVDNKDVNVELDKQEENASILIVDDDIMNLEVHEAMIK